MSKDYSVVKIGGSQYKVSKGDTFEVEKLEGKAGGKLKFSDVLLTSKRGKVSIGTPLVKGAVVEAKIIDQIKGKKVTTFKYEAKSRSRRKRGHRQLYTRVEITKI
jgi:large subunit ribosomal protein L21